MSEIRRFKYGIFFHPALPNPESLARIYAEELVSSFTDTISPQLGSVDVRWAVNIVRVDNSVVFAVEHRPEAYQLILDDQKGPVRSGLLEVLDWWNSETLLMAPADQGLVWDGPSLPNAWSNPWGNGLQLQTITQYPSRLGKRVLEEWNPGLKFMPFEIFYHPPTREQELEAIRLWTTAQELLVQQALKTAIPVGGPWFFAQAQRYRSALAPVPEGLRSVGSKEAAEKAAHEYRGLCFLLNQDTGEIASRWAER